MSWILIGKIEDRKLQMERAKLETKQYAAECWISNNLAQINTQGSDERGVKDTLRSGYEGPEVPGCVSGRSCLVTGHFVLAPT